MKKVMLVSFMAMLLFATIATVSAYEVDNYKVKYDKKTKEITVSYTEILDNECSKLNLRTYIKSRRGKVLAELGGSTRVPLCTVQNNDGSYFIDNRQTGEFDREYKFQLDKKLKGKRRAKAYLMSLPVFGQDEELLAKTRLKVTRTKTNRIPINTIRNYDGTYAFKPRSLDPSFVMSNPYNW